MNILGIDPGVTGAMDLIRSDGALIWAKRIPVIKVEGGHKFDVSAANKIITGIEGPLMVVCEKVIQGKSWSGGVNGVKSRVRLAECCMMMNALVVARGHATWHQVPPRTWQSRFSVGKDKAKLIKEAILLQPDLPEDKDFAAAAFIAEYGRVTFYDYAKRKLVDGK